MAELASLLAAGLFLLGMGGSMLKNAATQTRIYTPDESAFPNAQIGYAPMTDSAYAQDSLLRYVEPLGDAVKPQRKKTAGREGGATGGRLRLGCSGRPIRLP